MHDDRPSLAWLMFNPKRVFFFMLAWLVGTVALNIRLFDIWREIGIIVIVLLLGPFLTFLAARPGAGLMSKFVSYGFSSLMALHVGLSFFYAVPISSAGVKHKLQAVRIFDAPKGKVIDGGFDTLRKPCVTCAEWVTFDLSEMTAVFDVPLPNQTGLRVEVKATPDPDAGTMAGAIFGQSDPRKRISLMSRAEMISCALKFAGADTPAAAGLLPEPLKHTESFCGSRIFSGMRLTDVSMRILK